MFHVLQAGARAERARSAAKGLTGAGYDGHTFWDTETFVLPVLTSTPPEAAARRAALAQSTLDAGRRARRAARPARARRSRGGRSAAQECSGYWPAGTPRSTSTPTSPTPSAATSRATGDTEFEREVGLELLVATARLWRSLGHHDSAGGFRIDGVTGPDEYTAIVDNNVYTNLMAQLNLRVAADAAANAPAGRARARRQRGGDGRAGATRPRP